MRFSASPGAAPGSDWDGVIRMTEHMTPPRVLVLDDDSDLRLFLYDLLTEEGYQVDVGATLDEALALIDAHVYHLILTDLLTHSLDDPLRSAVTVRRYAYPTPVVALTGWNVTADDVARADLARLVPKPFDLTYLLTTISACLETRLSSEQRRQAETLVRYCEAFNAHDFDTCLSLCAGDVRYYPSAASLIEPTEPVVGRSSMRAWLHRLLERAPDLRFDDYLIQPQLRGLALRFVKSWRASAQSGGRTIKAASMTFQFKGERIIQMSLRMDGQNWYTPNVDGPYVPGVQPQMS